MHNEDFKKSNEPNINWLIWALENSEVKEGILYLKNSSKNDTIAFSNLERLEDLQGMAERLQYFRNEYYSLFRQKENWENAPNFVKDTIEINKLRGKLTQQIVDDLINAYDNDTQNMSFIDVQNKNYFKLLCLGMEVVPYLIHNMKQNRNWTCLHLLFHIVTEDKPKIPKNHVGKIQELTDDWIQWYEKKK